jgi:hypothetical protein
LVAVIAATCPVVCASIVKEKIFETLVALTIEVVKTAANGLTNLDSMYS